MKYHISCVINIAVTDMPHLFSYSVVFFSGSGEAGEGRSDSPDSSPRSG